MDQIIDVTGGRGGKAFLLVGTDKIALIDCGMAYCAFTLINNCKERLKSRALDYILISHSHYDHIGAIPYLRQEWPALSVLGAEYAQRVLTKPSALQTIRKLSEQAAELYGGGELPRYDDELLRVDEVVNDRDVLELGDMRIEVIKTIGHTQCSLSFLVNGHILFASETTGYMSKSGLVYPAFITSCSDAIESIYICQKLNPRLIISPHYGLVSKTNTADYWEKCLRAIQDTKEFILHLVEQGYDEQQILDKYEREFRDEHSRLEQPVNAFRLNTQSMIKTVLREE